MKNKCIPLRNDRKTITLSIALFYIVCFVASLYFGYLRLKLNLQYEHAGLIDLINNRASTPFQYRVLIPWLISCINEALLLTGHTYPPFQIAYYIEVFATFFLILMFRRFLLFLINNERLSMLLTFCLFYVLTFNYLLPRSNRFWYPSDIPSILFFTLGLLFLYRGQWLHYYIVFIAGCLNRETICFLTLVFLFVSIGKTPLRFIVYHCVIQFSIWVIIKIFLNRLYMSNPGAGLFESHIVHNIRHILNPSNYAALLSAFGFLWIPGILYYKRISSYFLRRSLLVAIPFFLCMFYVGNIYELRIYGELVPLIAAAFALILKDTVEMKDSTV